MSELFPNPVEALANIEELARQAQRDLQAGMAQTGAAALRKIECEAQDALRWAAQRELEKEAA